MLGVRLGYEDAKEDEKPPTMIMVNPEIVRLSDDVENAGEACLSIPGMMGSMPMTYMVNGKQYIAFTVGTPTQGAEVVSLSLEK